MPPPATGSLRLVIQQPALPAYRVPVFRALAQRPGIALTVYHGDADGDPSPPGDLGFESHRVPIRRLGPFRCHSPQWRGATRARADVLLLTWDLHYASLMPALLRARVAGVPTILWGHGLSKNPSPLRDSARRAAARLATALLFYNHTAAERYRAAGFDPQRLFVAPNSIDQGPIEAARATWDATRLAQFRREHALGEGPTILFVSRLELARRLDVLLSALPALASRFPAVRVIIIGSGDAERRRLEPLARSLGVAGHVRFLGAIHDEANLAPWFLTASAFCFPSHMGLSLLHALGYGVPVITGDNATLHGPEIESLRDHENGLLFTHDDTASLAEALTRLLSNPALATRLSREALRTVRERYTLGAMVDAMESAARFCAQALPAGPID